MIRIKWTCEEIEFLKREYPNSNVKEIAKTLGRTLQSITSMARVLNIKAKGNKSYKLKPLINNSLENYYWMGFIMADGHLDEKGNLSFQLNAKDKNHLEKLAIKIGVNVKLSINKTSYGACSVCRLSCKDIKYGVLLRNKMNITDTKTYNPPSLNFIKTKNQFLAFFSGYVDGDGTIGFRKNGRPELLRLNCHGSWIDNFKWMSSKLKEFGYSSTSSIDKRGYSFLRMTTSEHIIDIKRRVKNMKLPIMERKWR